MNKVMIECWDDKEKGNAEIDLGEETDNPGCLIPLHIRIPILHSTRTISVWLEDLERALRQLKLE